MAAKSFRTGNDYDSQAFPSEGQTDRYLGPGRASVKAAFNSYTQEAIATAAWRVEDLKLKARVTDATFTKDVGLSGVVVGVEKPGHFLVDYELEHKAPRFQFQNYATVANKPVRVTYNHYHKSGETSLEGEALLDTKNKLTLRHHFHSNKPWVRYSYTHDGRTTVEPSYDFATENWGVGVKQRLDNTDSLKLHYSHYDRRGEIEWLKEPVDTGSFRVYGSAILEGDKRQPTFVVEKTWHFSV
eukprot:SM000128S26204  [mRNA]  locus=s128:167662:168948:+ [translate_table: standard]